MLAVTPYPTQYFQFKVICKETWVTTGGLVSKRRRWRFPYRCVYDTSLKTATDSTCPVCGNKSNPLKLSNTYFPSRFPSAASSADHETICPTSLACVCTLQLTYTTVCARKASSCRINASSHPFRGGSTTSAVSAEGKSPTALKICAASPVRKEALCARSLSAALCVAKRIESAESSMPATCVKCEARVRAKRPAPQ